MNLDAVIEKLTRLRDELGDCNVSVRLTHSSASDVTHINSTTIGKNEVFIFSSLLREREKHTGVDRRDYSGT